MSVLRFAVILFLPIATPTQARAQAVPQAQVRNPTYDVTIEGMSCRQQPSGRLDCEYRVGGSLRFVIAGVGQDDVAVSFFRVDSIGDYYAGYAALHGCVVIKPTRQVRDSVASFAFVSPRDGKVYRSWQNCHQPARR